MRLAAILGTERIASVTAGILASLYAIGLLVQNLYLSQFGISEFAALRPRYVFVGLVYVLFLLAPLVPLVIANGAVQLLRPHFRRSRRLLEVATLLITAAAVTCALPYWYGVILVPKMYDGHGQEHPVAQYFWHFLLGSRYMAVPIVIFGVSFLALFIISRAPAIRSKLPSGLPPVLAVILLTSFLWGMHPYIYVIYPNVVQSLGGGQPQLVLLCLDGDASDILPKTSQIKELSAANPDFRGPYFLYYDSGEYLYLGDVNRGKRKRTITRLSMSRVQAMRTVPGSVQFYLAETEDGGQQLNSMVNIDG